MKNFRCSFKENKLTLKSLLTAAVVPGLQYQKHIFYGERYSKPYCMTSGGSEKEVETASFRYTKKANSSLYMHMQYIKNILL